MTDTTSGEVQTASLVGAMAVFPLNDILSLLAATGQTGELQVVGPGVDGHLWIDGKDLVGATLDGAKTITQAVFEMILLDEGWFYFTSDQAPPAGKVQHQSVSSVIAEVVPQVQEWRDLLKRVPLDSKISMARTTPGPEIQIRADQWHVLTAVGTNGRTVRSVVEEMEADSVVTVRLLRELADSGLVVVDDAGQSGSGQSGSGQSGAAQSDAATNGTASNGTASNATTTESATEPAIEEDQVETAPPPPPGFVSANSGVTPIDTTQSISSVPSMSTDFQTIADTVPNIPPPISADPWAPPGQGVSSS